MSDRVGGGGGRERLRRDYGSRIDEKGSGGRSDNPPSRHLWVGNLSHKIGEHELTDHFLQFGVLDKVCFQPGRSYAFINFHDDHDAIAAMKTLQGFPVAGNPLKIEFAKADKSSITSRTEDHLHRDEHRHATRASPFMQKDSRARQFSPEPMNSEKHRMSDKSSEPSEVLWIGFPVLLKVDEGILKKVFSPFGEIEKITAFPGRSYAFVQFRHLTSASKAKETLQGKLFGNPRVHICFAKSEAGPSTGGRGSTSASLSPQLRVNGRPGSFDSFHQDRNYGNMNADTDTRPPHFRTNVDSDETDTYNYNRKGALWSGDNDRRSGEVGSESRLARDMYELRASPRKRRSLFHDYPIKNPQRSSFHEEQWDGSEDAYSHGAKKLKTGFFPPDNELPEFPFSDSEKERHNLPRPFTAFPKNEALDKKIDARPFAYRQTLDHRVSKPASHGDASEHKRASSYDNFQGASGYLPSSIGERKKLTTESDQPSLNDWKWEGIIAKGGTPVCRARCFPVGKAMDIMLPELLDCTARTGLDMLAKHYYQASCAWVVFFVPGSDADMGFYNEFLHYLGDKQRAAVAKLDDSTTLFLVPPSDFSEKVLKVPGKLSIAGVVLRLEHPGLGLRSRHPPNEKRDLNLSTFQDESLYLKPSGPFPSGHSNLSFADNVATSIPFSGLVHAKGNVSVENNQHPSSERLGPNWCDHDQQNSVSNIRHISSQVLNSAADHNVQGYESGLRGVVQESPNSSHFGGEISGITLPRSKQDSKSSMSLSIPTSLQPEQLAQLTSAFLGQQGSTLNTPFEETIDVTNQFDNPYKQAEFSTSQFSQVEQISDAHVTRPPIDEQREFRTGNQQLQNSGTQEETDADPQKRLQATLQLAAALLHQIQQGRGGGT